MPLERFMDLGCSPRLDFLTYTLFAIPMSGVPFLKHVSFSPLSTVQAFKQCCTLVLLVGSCLTSSKPFLYPCPTLRIPHFLCSVPLHLSFHTTTYLIAAAHTISFLRIYLPHLSATSDSDLSSRHQTQAPQGTFPYSPIFICVPLLIYPPFTSVTAFQTTFHLSLKFHLIW